MIILAFLVLAASSGPEEIIECDICRQFERFVDASLSNSSTTDYLSDFFQNDFCQTFPPLYTTLCGQALVDNAAVVASTIREKFNDFHFCDSLGICAKTTNLENKITDQKSTQNLIQKQTQKIGLTSEIRGNERNDRLTSDPYCLPCRESVANFSANLGDPDYRIQLYKSAVEMCNSQLTPPMSTLCAELAIPAVPAIASLLKIEADTIDVCGTMHFCTDSNIKTTITKGENKGQILHNEDDIPICQVCKNSVAGMRSYFASQESAIKVRDVLNEGVCGNLTFFDHAACVALTGAYVPAAFRLAGEALDAADTCSILSLC
ncbi:hypothetical protein TRFO_29640 [Tritrichomonas foetus]|uniref:Saposin B-type domain-containing protein n=1 Tax=Tritrichomonas foetus TaxID=1144522 RepID=A0A1J4JV62_9EUKA|nr:hypothetical protein TRFO_29640 [Tritrichomonas foetus]|eukprot:OHT03033.1 hypothetical protein TRFO_29640 [Tritrichomonas foetus]